MADAADDLLCRGKRTDENLKDVIVLMTTLIFHRRVVSIRKKTSASDSSMMRIISFQPIRADLMRNKVSLPQSTLTVSQFKHLVVETNVPWNNSCIHVSSTTDALAPAPRSPLSRWEWGCPSPLHDWWLVLLIAVLLDLLRCFSCFSFSFFLLS